MQVKPTLLSISDGNHPAKGRFWRLWGEILHLFFPFPRPLALLF